MPNYDLSRGTHSITSAIRRTIPDLNDNEIELVSNLFMEEIGQRMERGERIAFLRTTPEGKTELTVLGLTVLKKVSGGQ